MFEQHLIKVLKSTRREVRVVSVQESVVCFSLVIILIKWLTGMKIMFINQNLTFH